MIQSEDVREVLTTKLTQYKHISFSEDRPLADQGISSLNLIVLLMEIESRFEIEVPPTHLLSLQTLAGIAEFVNGALDEKAARTSVDRLHLP